MIDGMRRQSTLLQTFAVFVLCVCAVPATAAAAPYVAEGEAKVGEKKVSTAAQARRRALHRARREALETALDEVSGPIDNASRKAVFGALDAWTGAYRVLAESTEGGVVKVKLEVDIDSQRLAKRVMRREASTATPMFVAGEVRVEGECGHDARNHVISELAAVGAVAPSGTGRRLDLHVSCRPLGLVRHTFVHAARVHVQASADGAAVADVRSHGFARDDLGAVSAALQRAVGDVAPKLGTHRKGEVVLRVQSPLPAARIRRLERAVRQSVIGVDKVELAGLDPDGAVRLRVSGDLEAQTLADRLGGLSLPGFSLTISSVDGPDTLTVRLD